MSRAFTRPARPTERHAGLIAAMAPVRLPMALTLSIGLAHGVEVAELFFSLDGVSAFTAVGVVILWQRPGHGIGRPTLAIGLLFAAIAGIAIANLVLQGVLTSLTTNDSLTVAASTLAVAALFNPIRSRVQWVVDRHFNRARHDAQLTVAGFTGRLRDQLDLPTLTAELRRTKVDAVEPSTTSVWLRTSGDSR